MKPALSKPPTDRGSALAMTLIICALLGALLGSYFYLIRTQHFLVDRSQRWHQTLVVAEAGVEEAMALLNSGVRAPAFDVFPWTAAGGGVFQNDTNRPGNKFADSYYEVMITNGFVGANPVILSRGYGAGAAGSPMLSRMLRVETRPRPTFPVQGPMIVLQTFDASGNNVGTDSFDSTLGPYNPSTAGTNGDVVTFSTNANSLAIGNGKIKGNVRTPPGGIQGVTATIGSAGSVGDSAWVDGGFTGFQAGHFQDNFTVPEFQDVTLPNVTWLSPGGSGTAPDGLIYDYLLPPGNYTVDSLSGSVYVGGSNVMLYVTTTIAMGSGGGTVKKGYAPPQIHIGPGASLSIYMAGPTANIGGNGVVNDSGLARNFQYYGLPSNTAINITGNGAFYGTIYAPEADFTLKGSGKTSIDDFTGASITKSTKMTGNFNFHFDESLSLLTTLGGYDVVSWEEL